MPGTSDLLGTYVQRMEALRDHLAEVHGVTREQTETEDPYEVHQEAHLEEGE